ncbi:putative membrane protein YkoI [Anaerotaenia torta]|uniref:PepSY domain-containing protein n=1 Tax=Anaerotaenia torta TaxID=433293 RepID=UPI003D2207A2
MNNRKKKIYVFAAALLLCVSLPAFSVSAAPSRISLETAKKTALDHAGASSKEVTFTKAKLEMEDGTEEYEIKFTWDNKKYEYEINASNGRITEYSQEKMKQKKSASKEKEAKQAKSKSKASDRIGITKAKEKVLSHAGYKASQVTFTKSKLDKEDGVSVYEIEFYIDGTEYEYEVNAVTGAIMDYETDDKDWD